MRLLAGSYSCQSIPVKARTSNGRGPDLPSAEFILGTHLMLMKTNFSTIIYRRTPYEFIQKLSSQIIGLTESLKPYSICLNGVSQHRYDYKEIGVK